MFLNPFQAVVLLKKYTLGKNGSHKTVKRDESSLNHSFDEAVFSRMKVFRAKQMLGMDSES